MKREVQIGENIKRIREKKGYSQEQLGRLANCSQKTISRYERGEVKMKIAILESIARALEVDLEELGYED